MCWECGHSVIITQYNVSVFFPPVYPCIGKNSVRIPQGKNLLDIFYRMFSSHYVHKLFYYSSNTYDIHGKTVLDGKKLGKQSEI